MKEATGELNMTVITIVAIAALAGFFYLVIWPGIQTSMALTSGCNSGPGTTTGDPASADGGVVCGAANGSEFTCTYSKNGTQLGERTCRSN